MATDPADVTAPDTSKLDKKLVNQIIQWETEADSLTGEADNFRSQAAGYIVKLLDKGASERQVAAAIGKSDSHVHFAAIAWRTLQGDTSVTDFQTAYKMAKRPAAQREADPEGTESQNQAEEEPLEKLPAWAKQMRTLKALVAEMTDQANEKQIGPLINALEKGLRAAISKSEADDNGSGGTE